MVPSIRRTVVVGSLIAAASAVLFAGCNKPPETHATTANHDKTPQSAPHSATPGEGEHGHTPSAHGGILVPIGSDSYHAEAVFEKGGILRLYTLGKNEATVLEVEAEPLTAFVKSEGGMESESVVLAPKPQPGDKAGMTSLFVGHLPKEVAGKKVEVTIPSIRIAGERFRIAFKSTPDAGDHGMPSKVADDDEKKLYLTPGGKYTEADIKANGNVTASQKFKGQKAEHDLKPKTGDKICPVTLTKANAKFTWVIDGKPYEFCCPPCVDEFVALAKEKPNEIKPPEEYRQK
jgi:YHS domain-containing protein